MRYAPNVSTLLYGGSTQGLGRAINMAVGSGAVAGGLAWARSGGVGRTMQRGGDYLSRGGRAYGRAMDYAGNSMVENEKSEAHRLMMEQVKLNIPR